MQLFLKRYKELNPDFDFATCPNVTQVRDVLRINTLKADESFVVERLKKIGVKLKKIKGIPFAYKYKSKFSIASTTEYALGYVYLQETASMLPPLILNPKKDACVLDMCSAPGSKTTFLAQLMNNKGCIIAVDINTNRLNALKSNLMRCGVKNTVVYKKDARFMFDLKKKFDNILLDAPCSGNFVIDEEFFNKRSIESFKQRSKLQKELLKSAYSVLKTKGVLVYSTCSLEPEENELVVVWFLNKYKDMALLDINLDIKHSNGLTKVFGKELNKTLAKTIRIWPNQGMQGFFVAKFLKKQ